MRIEFRTEKPDLRVDGRKIGGIAAPYGVASGQSFREMIVAGAFGDVSTCEAALNVAHRPDSLLARTQGRGLVFEDGPDALRFEAEIAETQEGNDCLELVRKGLLDGASVEMFVKAERMRGRVREVRQARLVGLALTHRPFYAGASVEARREAPTRRLSIPEGLL